MRVLVTGGAGFIGSHLVDRVAAEGHKVVVYDNFSSGSRENLARHEENRNVSVVEGDLLDLRALRTAMKGVDFVHHVAANPDIRFGTEHTDWDFQQNLQGTFHVLEAMRVASCKRLSFASSSTVYGEAERRPTPEDYAPLLPISLYGASKLGAEAYVSAYVGTFNFQGWIFRFANVVGGRATHGAPVDFLDKLARNPRELEILGDGRQRKSYLHVEELVEGMLHLIQRARAPVNVVNLGSDDTVSVDRIGELAADVLGLRGVRLRHTGGARGWPGDVPQMLLDGSAARALGWHPRLSSEAAVRRALEELAAARRTAAAARAPGRGTTTRPAS